MKVLHLLNTNSFSGAENVAITIIKNLGSEFDSGYVSLNGPIREKLTEEKIKFFSIQKMTSKELIVIIREFKPDIIHAHDFTTSIVAAMTKTRVPIVSHLHNNVPWLKKIHPYSFAYLIATLRFKKILGVSQSIFDEYIFNDFIKKKFQVISNPVNVKYITLKANTSLKEKFDIVFLGRLAQQKNPLEFIELIYQIKNKVPNLKVAMIGDGVLKDQCENKISELQLQDTISMLGFIDNPYGILSMSKALCMTSVWEGYGLVAVEALSLGVPVVASPVGGLTEIVNNECGLLSFDHHEYINEVTKLIENEEYWNIKSTKAYVRATELNNISEYMDSITNIYKEITNKH